MDLNRTSMELQAYVVHLIEKIDAMRPCRRIIAIRLLLFEMA